MKRKTKAGSKSGCMEGFRAGVVEQWERLGICCSRTMSASGSEHVLPLLTNRMHAVARSKLKRRLCLKAFSRYLHQLLGCVRSIEAFTSIHMVNSILQVNHCNSYSEFPLNLCAVAAYRNNAQGTDIYCFNGYSKRHITMLPLLQIPSL